jgi:hypothetical protein
MDEPPRAHLHDSAEQGTALIPSVVAVDSEPAETLKTIAPRSRTFSEPTINRGESICVRYVASLPADFGGNDKPS